MAPPQWAYQVENFVNEPDEELVCSICRSVFCEPVVCPCDHVYCQACIARWLENNRNCPICRKRVSNSSLQKMVPIIKNIINKLLLKCHNKSLGCTSQFSVESSEDHVKKCEYEIVPCKNKPCTDRLFRKNIMQHQTKECPHRCTKCKICGLKMSTALTAKHNCIRALQLRLRKKQNMIVKKNERIKALKNENKSLKAAAQGSAQSLSSRSGGFGLFDDITINLAELDSSSASSFSSDSDDSSESIIFLADAMDDSDNGESDSFFNFMDEDDSIEYGRNESASSQEYSEYHHAESQTAEDLPLSDQQNGSHFNRNSNSEGESASYSAVPATEESSKQRRPAKRRPTTEIPAKRRVLQFSSSSSDDDDSPVSQPKPKQCWRVTVTELDRGSGESSQDRTSSMDAGPSSSSTPAAGSGDAATAASDTSSNTKWQFSKSKVGEKRQKQESAAAAPVENIAENSTAPAAPPARNAVFERTLALLEQYNLESDPEWLPEYASHRGDTTESESSVDLECADESSSSELSGPNNESNNEENRPRLTRETYQQLLFRVFNHASDESSDDPDWDPITYLQNKYG